MHILTTQENHTLTIIFNRVDKKNAITSAMYHDMAQALRAAELDAAVRVVVFKGQ